MQLYRHESTNPKWNAQLNLAGRTHYVDDETLKFHKSRVLSARHTDQGLLFAIVTSDALDWQGTKRGFRYVIFDLFGTVVGRVELDQAFTTSAAAAKAMWEALNTLDVAAVNLAGLERFREQTKREAAAMLTTIETIADQQLTKEPTP